MIRFLFKLLVGRLVPALVLFLSVFIGWCTLDPKVPWEARLFVVVVPLLKGYAPPILFGHGKLGAKETPPVPADMVPRPRPEGELFARLEGSGDSMPLVGIGMCCRPTAYDDVSVERTIEWYLLLGGRHIDGAHLYLNHAAIGRGVANAVARGVPRSEIFVTTKVYPSHFGATSTRAVVEESLRDLGLDYLDMVLMHAPVRMLPGPDPEDCRDKTPTGCRKDTWKALSELRTAGLVRNVGVSNFAAGQIEELLELPGPEIAPVSNNQIQWNPWAPAEWVETVGYCRSRGIQITAYNSLGGSLENHKTATIDTLAELSEQYGRSVAQIMLRWALQSGAAIIPGTGNPEYMEENLSVYGFELSDADMDRIEGLREDLQGEFFTMKPRE